MMKSYQEWKTDRHFLEMVTPVIEWSIKSLWRRGMAKPESEEMTRIGQMLGKGQAGFMGMNYINPFGRGDYKQQADDFMSNLSDPSKLEKALGQAAQNSPLKQAYNVAQKLKQNMRGQNLNHKDIQMLVDVLKNAHKGGSINLNSLRSLWSSITGVIDLDSGDPYGQVDQDKKQKSLNYDVHIPIKLFKQLISVGNGMFTMPANEQEIYNDSAELLRHLHPEQFDQLYRKRYGHAYGAEQQPQKKKKNPPVTPGKTVTPPTPPGTGNQVDSAHLNAVTQELEDAMNQPDTNPNKQKMIQAAMAKLKGLAPSPTAPVPPAPKP